VGHPARGNLSYLPLTRDMNLIKHPAFTVPTLPIITNVTLNVSLPPINGWMVGGHVVQGTYHTRNLPSLGHTIQHGVQGTYRTRNMASKGHIIQGTWHPRDKSYKEHGVQGTYHTRNMASKGHIIQGTWCPWDILYNFPVISFGDILVGDELALDHL
jgi:hypothetical protein